MDSLDSHCEDSAQSAPPNFHFDSVLLNERSMIEEGDLLSQAMNVAMTGNTIGGSEEVNEGQRFLNSLNRYTSSSGDLLTSSLLSHHNEKETVQFEQENHNSMTGNDHNNFKNKILDNLL